MWLFTDIGFFSAVEVDEGRDDSPWTDDACDPGSRVMIRARDDRHLAHLIATSLPIDVTIYDTPEFDYRYRIIIEKEAFASLVAVLADRVTYSNFKSHVARESPLAYGDHWHLDHYVNALHRVWYIMAKAFPASLAQWLGLA